MLYRVVDVLCLGSVFYVLEYYYLTVLNFRYCSVNSHSVYLDV